MDTDQDNGGDAAQGHTILARAAFLRRLRAEVKRGMKRAFPGG